MSQDGCALDWDTICREVSAMHGAKPPMPDRFEMGPVAALHRVR